VAVITSWHSNAVNICVQPFSSGCRRQVRTQRGGDKAAGKATGLLPSEVDRTMSRVLPVLLLQQGVQELRVLHLEWLWRQQKQVMALL
jgi:hypothetical protein